MSGVSHLISQGFIDESRMGAMGWSQGGYISAFLTTNTDCFKAISVGAGISNWMTYYVNTDIPPFTRQYLKATPWDDPEMRWALNYALDRDEMAAIAWEGISSPLGSMFAPTAPLNKFLDDNKDLFETYPIMEHNPEKTA